jgi:hypothetical protein
VSRAGRLAARATDSQSICQSFRRSLTALRHAGSKPAGERGGFLDGPNRRTRSPPVSTAPQPTNLEEAALLGRSEAARGPRRASYCVPERLRVTMQRRTWGKLRVGPTSMTLVMVASMGYFFSNICVICLFTISQ